MLVRQTVKIQFYTCVIAFDLEVSLMLFTWMVGVLVRTTITYCVSLSPSDHVADTALSLYLPIHYAPPRFNLFVSASITRGESLKTIVNRPVRVNSVFVNCYTTRRNTQSGRSSRKSVSPQWLYRHVHVTSWVISCFARQGALNDFRSLS